MNLKTLSMANVHPSSVWKAEALKPGMIIKPYLERSMGEEMSKNLGDRPIYFRLVSLNAWLMIRLSTICLTSLSLLANSSLR